jgi:hypothetical protein
MTDDPLSNEVSISAELDEAGIKGKARSRTVSAFDRLLGNVLDAANPWLERRAKRARAITAGEAEIIKATAEQAVKQIRADPEFARRAIESHYQSVLRKQENRDAVARQAAEQLKLGPPSQMESDSGPDKVDDAFMARLESYVDGATSDELREKWGRVLASEIRTPGIFSAKAMRLVDEIDPRTAKLFERVCQFRLGDIIPTALSGVLSFDDISRLGDAGLMLESAGMGHVRYFRTSTIFGKEVWVAVFGSSAVAFERASQYKPSDLVKIFDGKPSFEGYILTESGTAIASILPDHQQGAVDELFKRMQASLPSVAWSRYEMRPDPTGVHPITLIETIPATKLGP